LIRIDTEKESIFSVTFYVRIDMGRIAVFLDRNGVLNQTEVINGKSYATRKLEDFIIEDEASRATQLLSQAGFLLVVLTNQPDVGNGLVA
jgi:D-glycero-D-manno-heptose 1,7-bisphosphate phosphatase